MRVKSFVDQLKEDLIWLEEITLELFDRSTINEFRNNPNSGVLIVAPPYNWGKLTSDGEVIQAKAIKLLDELLTKFDLLFDGTPKSVLNKYVSLKKYLNGAIKRGNLNWSVPASITEAKKELQERIKEMNSLLDWIKNLGDQDIIIVPDTNALIVNNRLESYGEILDGIEKWTVVITPIILKELDELKIKNTGNEFREKVKKTINYIKGLRNQGDALNGIQIYDKKVTFKLLAAEPNMNKTLPWLDVNNNDDRIIASCMEIQINNPASCVILFTGDINLQTKAQLARLPFIDPDND